MNVSRTTSACDISANAWCEPTAQDVAHTTRDPGPGRRIPLLVAALVSLLVAGCGGATATKHGSVVTSTLRQAADPSGQLRFVKRSLHATAGKVKVVFDNASPVPHNLSIQWGRNGPVVAATQIFRGGSRSLTVDLKPGRYTFYCNVPGHRAVGMQGTLTVR